MSTDARELRIRLPVEAMRYLRFQAHNEGDTIAALGGRLLGETLLYMMGERKRTAVEKMVARVKPETRDEIMQLFERGYTGQQIGAKLGLPYGYVMAQVGCGIDHLMRRIEERKTEVRPKHKIVPAAQPGVQA